MSLQETVLVIDDEKQIHRFLKISLETSHFNFMQAETAQRGLELIASHRPSVVILDLGLPDKDGLEVLKSVREWSQVPVIILSAKNDEENIIKALDAGADDYLTKPFSCGELLARIRVCLRRGNITKEGERIFKNGPLEVDLENKLVKLAGKEVSLTVTEFSLLKLFIRHIGKVLTHHILLKEVWGPSAQEHTQYLRVYIGHLRQKIEETPSRPLMLVTVSGVGYRLKMLPVEQLKNEGEDPS